MHNEIITIGHVTIYGYGLMIGIGVILAMLIGDKRAGKRGLNGELVYGLTITAVVLGFMAAKVLFIITNWSDFIKAPLEYISSEGFVVYGGLITESICALLRLSIFLRGEPASVLWDIQRYSFLRRGAVRYGMVTVFPLGA